MIGGGLFPNKLVHPVCKNFFKWATGSEGEKVGINMAGWNYVVHKKPVPFMACNSAERLYGFLSKKGISVSDATRDKLPLALAGTNLADVFAKGREGALAWGKRKRNANE